MKLVRRCPKCLNAGTIATERRPNGDSTCSDCRFKGKTRFFDTYIYEAPTKPKEWMACGHCCMVKAASTLHEDCVSCGEGIIIKVREVRILG